MSHTDPRREGRRSSEATVRHARGARGADRDSAGGGPGVSRARPSTEGLCTGRHTRTHTDSLREGEVVNPRVLPGPGTAGRRLTDGQVWEGRERGGWGGDEEERKGRRGTRRRSTARARGFPSPLWRRFPSSSSHPFLRVHRSRLSARVRGLAERRPPPVPESASFPSSS